MSDVVASTDADQEDGAAKKPKRKRRPRVGVAKGMRVRLVLTDEQEAVLVRWMGACRWTWNWALGQQNSHYASTQKHLGMSALSSQLTAALNAGVDPVSGRDITWLRDLPRTSLTCTLGDLKASWTAFFDGCSGKRADRPGKPRFKKFSDARKTISFQVDHRHRSRLNLPEGLLENTSSPARESRASEALPPRPRHEHALLANGTITLPVLGEIGAVFTEPVPGDLTEVTVLRHGGVWWASLALVNVPAKAAKRLLDWSVLTEREAQESDHRVRQFDNPLDLDGFTAIDASVPHGAVYTRNGKTVAVLVTEEQRKREDEKREKKKRYQRAYSRKEKIQREAYNQANGRPVNAPLPKGVHLKLGKRQRHVLDKAAKVDWHLANGRLDRTHKFTTTCIRESHTTIVETLLVRALAQSLNRGFRRRVHEAGIGEMFRQLKYKSAWHERTLIEVDKWFPSSKRCSNPACYQKNGTLKLSDRAWVCPHCHTEWERDSNASFNLWQEGVRIAYERHGLPSPDFIKLFAQNESTGYAVGSTVNRRASKSLLAGGSPSPSVEAVDTGKAVDRLRSSQSMNRESCTHNDVSGRVRATGS